MKEHQLINQSSGDFEYYTPDGIVEAARRTLGGGFDLDPASSPTANKRIKAAQIYEAPKFEIIAERNGLPVRKYADWGGVIRVWKGRIWMNHPFGKPAQICGPGCDQASCKKRGFHTASGLPGNSDWINAIVRNYKAGNITGCCITFASTSEGWFQPLLYFPQCFLSPRTNYYLPDGTLKAGVTKGSVVTYFGRDVKAFAKHYENLGVVKVTS